jgi:RNA recognition motif-containing protein
MPDEKEADKAIESLNGKEYFGHPLTVHQARFRTEDRRDTGRFGGRRHTDLPEIKR